MKKTLPIGWIWGIAINIYTLNFDFSGSKTEEKEYGSALGKALLSYAVKKETGVDTKNLTTLLNSHGKPYFQNFSLKFNISHTKNMVVLVTGKGDVGVDVEKIREFKISTAKRITTDNEFLAIENSTQPKKEFFSLWTFKEAFVKMLGTGLSYSLKKATLDTEESVLCVYPELKIFQFTAEDYYITAIEDGGQEVNIVNLSLNDILITK